MKLKILFLILLIIPVVIALPNDAGNSIDFSYTSPTNFSIQNVSHSNTADFATTAGNAQQLEGRDTATLKTYLQGLYDLVYCKLTGCTMTGNVTSNQWFLGKFNWTSGDDWNDFDGSTLLFNETYLNNTIHDWGFNETDSLTNYYDDRYYNKSQIDNNLTLYTLISNLVSYVGNWSADKINYWNFTELLNGTLVQNDTLYSTFYPITTLQNGTFTQSGNASWNESYANNIYYKNGDDANFTSMNTTTININEIEGACDLNKNHSICSNATGTYIIG